VTVTQSMLLGHATPSGTSSSRSKAAVDCGMGALRRLSSASQHSRAVRAGLGSVLASRSARRSPTRPGRQGVRPVRTSTAIADGKPPETVSRPSASGGLTSRTTSSVDRPRRPMVDTYGLGRNRIQSWGRSTGSKANSEPTRQSQHGVGARADRRAS
jgi:hypothetical protein